MNYKFQKSAKSQLKLLLTWAVIAISGVGCGGNKSSTNTSPTAPNNQSYPYYTQSTYACAASGGQGTQILVAPSEATYTNIGGVGGSFNMKFCLQLIGDANQITQWQNSGRAASYYYSGAFTLAGVMSISNVATVGTCVIPAGTYNLNSLSQGLYDPITFSGIDFEAVNGSNRVAFTLRNGWTRDPNMDYLVDRLSLDLVVNSVSVNGVAQPCNNIQGLFFN